VSVLFELLSDSPCYLTAYNYEATVSDFKDFMQIFFHSFEDEDRKRFWLKYTATMVKSNKE
jgi:hypothetical protein